MKVTVTGGTLSQQEQDAYIARAYRKYPHNQLESLEIHVDGDYVDLSYTLQPQKSAGLPATWWGIWIAGMMPRLQRRPSASNISEPRPLDKTEQATHAISTGRPVLFYCPVTLP